jgi:hypothetical protein
MHVPQDNVHAPLYVIGVVFNPTRSKVRWKLYRDFQRYVREAGAVLITVEAAFGERTYALEQHAQPGALEHPGAHKSHGPAHVPPAAALPASRAGQDYLKFRVGDLQEIWLKENLQNLAARHLPPDARYVAFVDIDTQFLRPDWVSETLHALQHWDVVQMFSTAVYLSPTYEPLRVHRSFGYDYVTSGIPNKSQASEYHQVTSADVNQAWHYHPGFAWAWRVQTLSRMGGLMERAITGPNDHHMAWGLVGCAEETIAGGVTPQYRSMVMDWQDAAQNVIKGNVGYVDGTIFHHWHGREVKRGYGERWAIVIDYKYDPGKDVRPDVHGVLSLTGDKPKMRDALRRYFRSRNEDSIEVPDADHHVVEPKPLWTQGNA